MHSPIPPPHPQDTGSPSLSLSLTHSLTHTHLLTHTHTPFDKLRSAVRHDYRDKSIPGDSDLNSNSFNS